MEETILYYIMQQLGSYFIFLHTFPDCYILQDEAETVLKVQGDKEILRHRAVLAKLEGEKEEILADKEKADREMKEAEADRKFRAVN